MRFVCRELGGDTLQLYRSLQYEQECYVETNGLVLYPIQKKEDSKQGTVWLYATESVRAYQTSRAVVTPNKTLAGFAAEMAVSLTTNLTNIASNDLFWNVKNVGEVWASYWYTILTETGLWLVSPQRLTTSSEISGKVIARSISKGQTPVYTGESGGDYKIGTQDDNIGPETITATFKKLAMDKELSQDTVITIQSSAEANPLDYYNDDGTIYLVVSRGSDSDGNYIYTAVKEIDNIYTFSGSDIVISDPWHYVGATGEPAFLNSWANYGYEYSPACFRKIDGWVILQGMIKSGSIGANAFTLPAGYRPTSKLIFMTAGSDGTGGGVAAYRKDINSVGGVQIYNGSNNWQSLNGITFFVGR